jgi:hypothetical protein
MPQREFYDVKLHYHFDAPKAIMVSENGDVKRGVWLPKSQIEYVVSGNEVDVTAPEWLLKDKGLI